MAVSANGEENYEELNRIALVVHALIVSRKPPAFLSDILKDYKEMECEPLPFAAMGYKTAEDLLEATGKFGLTKSRTGTIVVSKVQGKSNHISKLVRKQTSKRRGSNKSNPRRNKQSQPFTRDDVNNDSKSSSSGEQRYPSQLNARTSQQTYHNKQCQLSDKNIALFENIPDNSHPQQHLPNKINCKKQPMRPILGAKNSLHTTVPPLIVNEHSNSLDKLDKFDYTNNNVYNDTSNCIYLPSNNVSQLKNNGDNFPQPDQLDKFDYSNNNVFNMMPNCNYLPSNNASMNSKGMISQFRNDNYLLQPDKLDKFDYTNNNVLNKMPNCIYLPSKNVSMNSKGTVPQLRNDHYFQQSDLKMTTDLAIGYSQENSKVVELLNYCKSFNYEEPVYKIYKNKFSPWTYSCSVKVNMTTYSIYPNEYHTENEAKEAGATLALNKLLTQSMKDNLPVCPYDNETLLTKLYVALLTRPHGIILNNLPEWFESTFNYSIPENCIKLIQTSNHFITEETLNDKVIVYANTSIEESETNEMNNNVQYSENGKDYSANKKDYYDFPAVELPWLETIWNIYITYVESPSIAWGRLLGNNYNTALCTLIKKYECEVKNDASKERVPTSVNCQGIYLVLSSEMWCRVRVEEIELDQKHVFSHFIDYGNSAWLPVEEIKMCPNYLLDFPAQAFPFSVYGMEEFEDHPAAMRHANAVLKDSVVVGIPIHHMQDEMQEQDDKGNREVVLNLYDSVKYNVNISQKIQELIYNDVSSVPNLEENTYANVKITHVCNNGDCYLQVMGNEFDYLKILIEKTVKQKLKENIHQISNHKQLEECKMFLVKDKEIIDNEQWFRAKLSTKVSPDKEVITVFYIDYGIERTVNMTQIYCLQEINFALYRYPPQAILVRLDKIPTLNSILLDKMHKLLPTGKDALVKLIKIDKMPLVNVYVRIDQSEALCTINDMIIIEFELNKKNTIQNNLANHSKLTSASTLALTSSWDSLQQRKVNPDSGSTSSSFSSSENIPRFLSPVQRLNTNNGQTAAVTRQNSLPTLNDFAYLPKPGDCVEVRVTIAPNPTSFMVQIYNRYKEYRDLMVLMQDYYKTHNEPVPREQIEIGKYYAALHIDKYFHRVIVQKKVGNMFSVLLCDFGEVTTLGYAQLRRLPSEYQNFPRLALCATLYGIQPSGNQWTNTDCQYYRQLTVGKKFMANIFEINSAVTVETNYCPLISVYLIDTSSEDDILLHDLLLQKNIAKLGK